MNADGVTYIQIALISGCVTGLVFWLLSLATLFFIAYQDDVLVHNDYPDVRQH